MTFIGPRPALYNQEDLKIARTKLGIHRQMPGITGWAQVNGRNLLNWDKRLEMDVEYVEKLSFGLDIRILFKTIGEVLGQHDVLEVSSETVPDFDDYRKQKQSPTNEN